MYLRATLRGGETYRLFGNRGTARYVGLQTMDGIVSTTNCLVDELDVDADGNFEVILSRRRARRQLAAACRRPSHARRATLLLRLGHREAVVAADRAHRRRGRAEGPLGRSRRRGIAPAVRVGGVRPRQPEVLPRLRRGAAGQRVHAADRPLSMGAAAENRPVIGRFELEPDEALILEVEPPKGVYWSFSLGNPWWETIHYGRHQSSLNGHQAVVDPDGILRVSSSLAGPRCGELARYRRTQQRRDDSALRANRNRAHTERAGREVRRRRLGAAGGNHDESPPQERAGIIEARRRAVHERFSDELLRRRTRRRRARRHRPGRLRFALLPRRSGADRRGAEHRGRSQRPGQGDPARDHQQCPDPAAARSSTPTSNIRRSTTRSSRVRCSSSGCPAPAPRP